MYDKASQGGTWGWRISAHRVPQLPHGDTDTVDAVTEIQVQGLQMQPIAEYMIKLRARAGVNAVFMCWVFNKHQDSKVQHTQEGAAAVHITKKRNKNRLLNPLLNRLSAGSETQCTITA